MGRVVEASAAHPQLAIQGDAVSVRLTRGHVLATAVGPRVPEDGRFPVPATSPCSFTVTLAAAGGVVPVGASSFSILDELGHIHHPRVTSATGGAPAVFVRARRPVRLTIDDVLPTGNGRLRWAPEGTAPVVSWDFDVEID